MQAVSPPVLSTRVLPRTRTAAVLAVLGFAALTAAAAQWRIPLEFTPVPITGQTFAVLLSGAALGMRLGAASQVVYLAAGFVGFPVFTDATSGWDTFVGPTSGYLIGFVFAAAVVGRLAERRHDRTLATAFSAFVAGSIVIYATGVAGLLATTGMDVETAILNGVAPFVFGDVIKAAVAGSLTPLAWRILGGHPATGRTVDTASRSR